MTRRHALLGLLALAALVPGCSSGTGDQTVLVSAAASLGDAFTDIAAAYETDHPGVIVELNLGGSSTLREQIVSGAPVDVFASANDSAMAEVIAEVDASFTPEVFATNSMVIAVPPGNPREVSGLDDFADPDLFIGLCAIPVPCGVYGEQVLENAGVVPSVDTRESDVTSLLLKIALGELDAGIVYQTDVNSRQGTIGQVPISDTYNVTATYTIVALEPSSGVGKDFVEFVLSDPGQAILRTYGFGAP